MKLSFGPFNMFVNRIHRYRLRRIMRGYRNLRRSGKLGTITQIRRELTTCNLNIDERLFSVNIFGEGLASAELIIRQYLLLRVSGLNLNRALLDAAGESGRKVVFSMPKQWIEVVEKNGFEVNRYASSLMWAGYVAAAYFYGLCTIGKILKSSLGAQSRKCPAKPYAYFHALSPNNIPSTSSDGVSYDIVSWYLQWQGKQPDLDAIHHTVRNLPSRRIGEVNFVEQKGPLPMLAGLREFAKYSNWALLTLINVTCDALRARWWHALLLSEAALAAQARTIALDHLAQEYLFHHWIYRPLWTYEVERRGKSVILYFYSTNHQPIDQTGRVSSPARGWDSMNWPRYLVWDEAHASQIRQAVGQGAKIDVVGSVWFTDGPAEIPQINLSAVAVFDIPMRRRSKYVEYALSHDIYRSREIYKFLVECNRAADSVGSVMFWKRKRPTKTAGSGITRIQEDFAQSKNILVIDSTTAPHRLIAQCNAVISIPYTSTGVIARDLGIPSVYYDPTGTLQNLSRCSHGIETISRYEDLIKWLNSYLVDPKLNDR